MYLAFKKLKISCKLGTEWLEAKKEGTTDVSRNSNATSYVRVTLLDIKLHEVRSE